MNAKHKIIIICPQHGEFLKIPNDLLNRTGCPNCKKEICRQTGIANGRLTKEIILERFKNIHGDFYDYSLVKYNRGKNKKVKIICRQHGIFEQTTEAHSRGQGCTKCFYERYTRNLDTSIEKQQKTSKFRKEVLLPSGNKISLQGFEPYFLDTLLDLGLQEHEILHRPSHMPKIKYVAVDGKIRNYRPDFFIPKENRLIEIKSAFTASIDINLENKLKATQNLGYIVELHIITPHKFKHIKVLGPMVATPKNRN